MNAINKFRKNRALAREARFLRAHGCTTRSNWSPADFATIRRLAAQA